MAGETHHTHSLGTSEVSHTQLIINRVTYKMNFKNIFKLLIELGKSDLSMQMYLLDMLKYTRRLFQGCHALTLKYQSDFFLVQILLVLLGRPTAFKN